jgi:hypothetical protein
MSPKCVLLLLNLKFKCTYILITSKPLRMKHYRVIFFHDVKFSLLYDENSMKKKH